MTFSAMFRVPYAGSWIWTFANTPSTYTGECGHSSRVLGNSFRIHSGFIAGSYNRGGDATEMN
jgi:hypothetical protein